MEPSRSVLTTSRASALALTRRILAANCACEPEDFSAPGVTIVEVALRAGIGVSVLPAHRGAGIGAAVVSACARAVLDAGRVPYYSTDLSNLKSQAAALGGFVPAWTEAYVYVPRQQRVDGDYLGLRRLGQAPVSTQPA